MKSGLSASATAWKKPFSDTRSFYDKLFLLLTFWLTCTILTMWSLQTSTGFQRSCYSEDTRLNLLNI